MAQYRIRTNPAQTSNATTHRKLLYKYKIAKITIGVSIILNVILGYILI